MKTLLFLSCYAFVCMAMGSCEKDKPGGNSATPPPPPPSMPDKTELFYVYKEGTSGYEVFRIPALVKAKSGTLLAFAEARKKKSSGDSGDIDLVVKRSTDNGKTWGEMIMVWSEGSNTCGNPVPIVDEQTGRVHLLMTWNHGDDKWEHLVNNTGKNTRRPYYTYSDDEGKTWAPAVEITHMVKKAYWDWYGTGPVHGIQLKKGAHKGRLVAPCYYTLKVEGQRKDYSHVIYSDDQGVTWKIGDTTHLDKVGESTVSELSNGDIMLNMRTSAGTARRYCISQDGGETWGPVQTDYTLLDPQCQGSLLSVDHSQGPLLFFSNAASVERVKMTVKMSSDDGRNWSKQFRVHEGPSAYSDLVQTSANEIAILFEGGVGRPYEGIAFKAISLELFK